MNALVQHLDQTVDHLDAKTGNAKAEGVDPHGHHGADPVFRSRIANAAAMGHDDVELEAVIVRLRNRIILQLADAGVETIGRRCILGQPMGFDVGADLDDFATAFGASDTVAPSRAMRTTSAIVRLSPSRTMFVIDIFLSMRMRARGLTKALVTKGPGMG